MPPALGPSASTPSSSSGAVGATESLPAGTVRARYTARHGQYSGVPTPGSQAPMATAKPRLVASPTAPPPPRLFPPPRSPPPSPPPRRAGPRPSPAAARQARRTPRPPSRPTNGPSTWLFIAPASVLLPRPLRIAQGPDGAPSPAVFTP